LKYNPKDNVIRRQPRSSLLVMVLVAGLIIVFAFTLTDYFKQQRVQNSLRGQIEVKRQELISAPEPATDLRQQLEKAENENQAAMAALSAGAVNSTEIITALLETAGACGLIGGNLTTEKWATEGIGNSTYRLMPVNVDLKGTVSSLRLFMEKLENRSDFPALAVKNLSIAGPEETAARNTGVHKADVRQAEVSNDEQNLNQEITARLTVAILTKTEKPQGEY
jgi:hypothetical protein